MAIRKYIIKGGKGVISSGGGASTTQLELLYNDFNDQIVDGDSALSSSISFNTSRIDRHFYLSISAQTFTYLDSTQINNRVYGIVFNNTGNHSFIFGSSQNNSASAKEIKIENLMANKTINFSTTITNALVIVPPGKRATSTGFGKLVTATIVRFAGATLTRIFLTGDLDEVNLDFAVARAVGGLASDYSNLEGILNAETSSSEAPFYIMRPALGDPILVYDQNSNLFTLDPRARGKIVLEIEGATSIEEALLEQDFVNSTARYKIFPFEVQDFVFGTDVLVNNEYRLNYYQTQAGTQFSDDVTFLSNATSISLTIEGQGRSYSMESVLQNVTVNLSTPTILESVLDESNKKTVQYLNVNVPTGRTFTFTVPSSTIIYDSDTGGLVASKAFTVTGAGTFIIEASRQTTTYRYFISTVGFAASGGGVQSVVAGTNITVDNSNPSNPIVSSTGGVTVDATLSSTSTNPARNSTLTNTISIVNNSSLRTTYFTNATCIHSSTDHADASTVVDNDRDVVLTTVAGTTYQLTRIGSTNLKTQILPAVISNPGREYFVGAFFQRAPANYDLLTPEFLEYTLISGTVALPGLSADYTANEIEYIIGPPNGFTLSFSDPDRAAFTFTLSDITANTFGEEGTFTPTLTANGATYNVTASGQYTRIGEMIFVTVFLNSITQTGTATGSTFVGGLPFSSDNSNHFGKIAFLVNSNHDDSNLTIANSVGTTTVGFSARDVSPSPFIPINFTGTGNMAFSYFYRRQNN